MRYSLIYLLVALATLANSQSVDTTSPYWPPGSEEYRVKYVGEIRCADLKPEGGFLKSLARWLGGKGEHDQVSLPFDLVVEDGSIFMICQNIPALVEIDRKDEKFKLHRDKKHPLNYPVSLCKGSDGIIFVSDSGSDAVYRYKSGKLKLLIDSGLSRPTGLAAFENERKLYVVNTGEHNIKVFDYEGRFLSLIEASEADGEFNYPTFAKRNHSGQLLINDALSYQIKRLDQAGKLLGAFGSEGDSPGTFARPKGIALDSDNHIYVVDNLFDNFQIFDSLGTVLLAVGSRGNGAGQFWSPAGIAIEADTIYVADTFNDRIQILYYRSDQL